MALLDKQIKLAPSPSSGVPHAPKAVPDNMKAVSFSDDFTGVDDFKTEQLPVQGTASTGPKLGVEDDKKEEAPVSKEKKENVETTEDVVPVPDPEDKTEKEEEVEKKEEKSGLSKFLKPPVTAKEGEKKEEKKTEVVKSIGISGKVVRDYAGHTPEEISAFKKMSDEGYTFTKKLIESNKELKKLEGTTYLQHENAYVLDPSFQSLRQDIHYANKEAEFWQEQLIAMDSGKPWREMTSWDQQGNPVVGPEQQATKRDEERVRVMMNNCYQAVSQLQGKMQQYPQQYKQRVQTDLQAINDERANRFEWVKNPTLMDHSIHVEGLGDRTLKQVRQDFQQLFPAYLRNHPAIEVAADLMIALRIQDAQLKELTNGSKVEEIKNEEQELVEPHSDARRSPPKSPVHGVTEFKALPEQF